MDCQQLLAKMIIERMDQLGWLAPVNPTLVATNVVSDLPQCEPQTATCTYISFLKRVIVVINQPVIGLTYELTLTDASGKRKMKPSIALYYNVAQQFYFDYPATDNQSLYVTLKVTKKGYLDSVVTLNEVLYE